MHQRLALKTKPLILGCIDNKQWISHGLQSVGHNPRIMIHGLFAVSPSQKRGLATVEAETVAKPRIIIRGLLLAQPNISQFLNVQLGNDIW